MIDNDRINGRRKYTCDGDDEDSEDGKCKAVAHFKNYDEARASHWSVSYWRTNCYCPKCAPKYKNVGCAGIKTKSAEQLKIGEG